MRLGIDLGGSKIEIVALASDGSERLRRRIATPQGDYRATLQAIAGLVASAENETGELGSVGIGIPGAESLLDGRIKNANSTCLNGQPLRADLRTLLQREVRLANDANCFALSEAVDGAGRGARCVFGVILGTGVGGGLVLDGKLFVGGKKNGFEFGHAVLVFGGEPCTCGQRGCIESYCSAAALVREGRKAAQAHHESAMYQRAQGDLTRINAKLVMDCAKEMDEAACAVYDQFTAYLGATACTAIALFDPEIIAFGGGVSNDGEFLLAPIREYARKYAFFKNHAKIVTAEMKNDAGIVGAAMLYLQR